MDYMIHTTPSPLMFLCIPCNLVRYIPYFLLDSHLCPPDAVLGATPQPQILPFLRRRVPLAEVHCSILENPHIVHANEIGQRGTGVRPVLGGVEASGIALGGKEKSRFQMHGLEVISLT